MENGIDISMPIKTGCCQIIRRVMGRKTRVMVGVVLRGLLVRMRMKGAKRMRRSRVENENDALN
jgi:hypothetical protein